MAEPAATACTAASVAAGLCASTVTIMGAQVDALIVGLFFAFLSAILMPSIDGKLKAGAGVAVAALLAGYGAHVAAGYLAPKIGTDIESFRLLAAAIIGLFGPATIPSAIKRFTREVETRGVQ